jgi:hypothetical protein
MPLQSVDVPARDEGFEIGFMMTDGAKQVRCYVQQGALDKIEYGRPTSAEENMDRFNRYRTAFEAVASSLYDAGLPLRITSAHLTMLLAFAKRSVKT